MTLCAFPMFEKSKELPVVQLQLPESIEAGVDLFVLRLDKTDELVSGNKWFKLKYNLTAAKAQGAKRVLSFGGAYSNHIHALAWAGRELGVKTIGIIRGEPAYADNPTLADAARWGMELVFVSRAEYRRRSELNYLAELRNVYGDVIIIPEGGSNALAVKGAAEIITDKMRLDYGLTHVVLPCGTGGTLAGIASSQPCLNIVGIPVLKGAQFLVNDIQKLLQEADVRSGDNWLLDFDGHYGGYAKTSPELLSFISEIKQRYQLPLDQVYTGKMMFRFVEMLNEGAFPSGSSVLLVHTGGLQGLRSLSCA